MRRERRRSYEALRGRMVRETEAALSYARRVSWIGVCRPGTGKCAERFPRIPTVEVGTGEFDPRLAARYWEHRLGLDGRPDR